VNLFNKIIQSGKIPKVFKTGILTPIHKKGKDPTLTTNYRGITVTSVLGKQLNMHFLKKCLSWIIINQICNSDLQEDYHLSWQP
jgi:hypothetical protein